MEKTRRRRMTRRCARAAAALGAAAAVTLGHAGGAAALEAKYDSLNRLVESTSGPVTETYKYDGWGNLVETCRSVSGAPATCTEHIVDEVAQYPRIVADIPVGGGDTRYYAYDVTGLAAVKTGTGGVEVAAKDHAGSVRAFVDGDGDVTDRRAYDAFGARRAPVTAGAVPYGYTGERETTNGLVYLRARHYAPEMGRFLQRDTFAGVLDRPTSLNRYAYAENDPLNKVDPSGHQATQPHACGAWAEDSFVVGRMFGLKGNEMESGGFPVAPRTFRPSHPPEFNWSQRQTLESLSRRTNSELFHLLYQELVLVFGRDLGVIAWHRFQENHSQPLVSAPGSPIADAVAEDPEGLRVLNLAETRVVEAVRHQMNLWGNVDPARLRIDIRASDRAYWGPAPFRQLSAVHGGTDGLEVELAEVCFDPMTFRFDALMRVKILDTFGVETTDFDTPSQAAMWVLQHQRGIQPFHMQTIVERRISVQLDRKPFSRHESSPVP